MQDITITCVDCGKPFDFTVAEQEFYQSRGLTNQPKRCADCRAAKKARMNGGHSNFNNNGPRQMFSIVCANCGREDTVPFKPRGDKPVLCRDCFRQQKTA